MTESLFSANDSDLTSISVDLGNADFAAIPTADAHFSMSFLYFGRSVAAHDR
jgi:hypothetical protein